MPVTVIGYLFLSRTVTVGSFYRALYSYDPSVSSPNGEGASEELTFYENCVIKVMSLSCRPYVM